MRIVYYYRCPDLRLIEAKAKDNTRALHVEEQGKAFASLFGGRPVFTQGFSPRFAGVTFSRGEKDVRLWTPPTSQNPTMLPRSPQSVNKHFKEPARQLQDRFRKHWPADAAQEYDSELLTALGVSTAATFGNALSYFYAADKVSWVASTLPLSGRSLPVAEGEMQVTHVLESWQEVLASEFDTARSAFKLAQAQAANEVQP